MTLADNITSIFDAVRPAPEDVQEKDGQTFTSIFDAPRPGVEDKGPIKLEDLTSDTDDPLTDIDRLLDSVVGYKPKGTEWMHTQEGRQPKMLTAFPIGVVDSGSPKPNDIDAAAAIDGPISFRQGEEVGAIKKLTNKIIRALGVDSGMKARAVVDIVKAEQLSEELGVHVTPSMINPGIKMAWEAGKGSSAYGELTKFKQGKEYPNVVGGELDMFDTVISSASSFWADKWFFAAGGILGSGGTPAGTIAGAFALPAGARKAYMEMNRLKAEGKTEVEARELLSASARVAYDTLLHYAIGKATGEVKAMLPANIGQLPIIGAETATFTTLGAAAEGRLPEAKDFISAAMLITAMHMATGSVGYIAEPMTIKGRLEEAWIDSGITPEGLVELAKGGDIDKVINELVSKEGLSPESAETLKTKVKELQDTQIELTLKKEAEKQKKVDAKEALKQEREAKRKAVGESKKAAQKTELPDAEEPVSPYEVEKMEKQKTKLPEAEEPIDAREVKKTPEEEYQDQKEGEFRDAQAEAEEKVFDEPIVHVDEQTGSKVLGVEDHPMRETNIEHTTGTKVMYEGKPESLRGGESMSRYLINEVNHYLNGGDIEIDKVIDTLDRLASESDRSEGEFRYPADFREWQDYVAEAASWAKEEVRLKNKRSGGGTRLNVGIPIDEVPKMVKNLLRLWEKTGVELEKNELFRNEQIYDATGFWWARDGKMRYELDPEDIKFVIEKPQVPPREVREMLRRDGSTISNQWSEVSFTVGKLYDITEIIDAPKLFEAVPGIKDLSVKFDPTKRNAGSYNPDLELIKLSTWDRGTAVHELQHAVNEYTGSTFKGTSSSYQRTRLQMAFYNRLLKLAKDPEVVADVRKLMRQTVEIGSLPEAGEKLSNIINKVENKQGKIDALSMRDVVDEARKLNARDEYMKDPGEMEARLAEERMKHLDSIKLNRRIRGADIKPEYPWETLDRMLAREGYEGTGTKLYSGIDPGEVAKELVDLGKGMRKYVEEARGIKSFKPGEAAGRTRTETVRTMIDRSGNIRKEFLNELGDKGYEIIQKMYLSKGASSIAARRLKQMSKDVYAGLNKNERRILDTLILSDRVYDIAQYKTEQDFNFPKNASPMAAVVYKEIFKELEGISSKQAETLTARAKAYFEWMKVPLKDLLDSQLISQADYDNLVAHNYRRLRLVDVYDQKHSLKKGSRKRTVYDSGVDTLAKGRETDIFEPSSEIMALEVFNRAYGRIMNNEANLALLDLARTDKNNPYVRFREKGSKERIPTGWQSVFVYEGGVKKAMWMSPEMAKEWITSSSEMTYMISQLMRYGSGSPILRMMATGLNWGFAVANLPRDIMHAWFVAQIYKDGKTSKVYSPTAPKFAAEMARDQGTVFMDALLRKGRYDSYINEGGGMEFLVHQGRLFQRGKHIRGPLDPLMDFFGYMGETTEIMTRLAIRERVIRRRAKQQGLTMEEARNNKDIKREATFAARDYMDFSQGGSVVKTVDNMIPYLNASVQGSRGIFRAMKDNKAASAYILGQFAGTVTGLYVYNQHRNPKAMAALKDDRNFENNIVIPLGDDWSFIDSQGQTRYMYIKIPLDPGQRFFKKFFEASADKWLGNEVDGWEVTKSLTNLSPVDMGSMPPTYSAFYGYVQNRDFWQNDDIWKKTDPFSYPLSGQEFDKNTPEFYKDLGQKTGLSPDRSQYAVEQLLTRGTVFSYAAGTAYEKIFSDMPEKQRKDHIAMIMARAPMAKRLFGVTNPYSKFAEDADRISEQDAFKTFDENRGLDVVVDGYLYADSHTKRDVRKYIKGFRDKDTQDRLWDRYDFAVATKDLPNRTFWMSMQGINSPEARAKYYVTALSKSTPEEQVELKQGLRSIDIAGGLISSDFYTAVRRLHQGRE